MCSADQMSLNGGGLIPEIKGRWHLQIISFVQPMGRDLKFITIQHIKEMNEANSDICKAI